MKISSKNSETLGPPKCLGRPDVAIVWAMTELVKNPRVMKKVQKEIRSCVGRKPNVNESELEKLGYLKMVVNETLRLHPPIGLLPCDL